ncbi:tripartite tricarboxylate transporter TctB family protein [Rhodopseudomonas sp. HC1]|uniref:tripartite tricarboxylate transporter TctB family protein n=1 Tax=Rhodopseudomonas infernalis TaxID=2897386 RepID=UPI001EE860B0|nr:tripartite tricarboxylate transporter TctB family protein [Rhodopseudomonas infernalis]MCG6205229.1 tripartite tricarboxylate transporter TctB family protein [Rhodopseudomonas infernalis]
MKSVGQSVNEDVCTGALLAVVAIVALSYIRTLEVGTVLEMGPGYFPFGLAVALLGMGLILILKGVLIGGVPVQHFHLRPLFFILISFAAFGALLERAGMVVAVLAQVGLAALASRETTLLQTAVTAVGCAAASSVLFVWVLQIPVSVWP